MFDPASIPYENTCVLDAEGKQDIGEIIASLAMENLWRLRIENAASLRSVGDLSGLRELSVLQIDGALSLTSLADLRPGPRLKVLDLHRCKALLDLPDAADLGQLTSLRLSHLYALRHLPEPGLMPALESLMVESCVALSSFPDLSVLQHLRHLQLDELKGLGEIPSLDALHNLRSLSISGYIKDIRLPKLASLQHLETLNLSSCEALEELPDFSALHALKRLNLGWCARLQSLPGLETLKNLEHLNLSSCFSLENLPDLSPLSQLETLSIGPCKKIPAGHRLNAPNLRRLRIASDGEALPFDLSGLSQLTHLESVGLPALQSIPADTLPRSLKELDLSQSKQLREIPALASLEELEELHLTQCLSLEGLPDLSKLTRLRVLRLGKAESLTHLPSLANQKELVQLEVWECRNLRELPDLSHLTRLEELSLAGCHSLQTLPDLSAQTRLRKLDLEDCPLLRNAEIAATTRLTEFSHNDPEFVARVLAQTRARVSGEWFFKDVIDWCILIPQAKDPGELLGVVAEGFQKCRGPETPDTALADLITAALKTEVGKLTAPAWRTLFGCFDPSVPDERAKLENLLAQLPPDRLLHEALGPCLDWLGQCASAEHAWGLPLAERLLGPHSPAVLRPLAPDICLFFHRLGDEDRFRHWLHVFTDPAEPETLDPVHAALARDALTNGNLHAAQAHLARVHRPELRDPVLADLARALAASHPLEAGEALNALFSAARQAGLAQDLLAEPAFTAEAANLYRLLLHLEDDPPALATLIETTLTHTNRPGLAESVRAVFAFHPRLDLPTVTAELTRLAAPAQGTDLPRLAAAFLNRPAVTEVTKPRQLAEFRNRLETHPELLEQALHLGLIALLQAEGLIDETEAAQLRAESGKHV